MKHLLRQCTSIVVESTQNLYYCTTEYCEEQKQFNIYTECHEIGVEVKM